MFVACLLSCCRVNKLLKQPSEIDPQGQHGGNMQADAKPGAAAADDEEPVWVKREREEKARKEGGSGLPFGLYLLFSSFVAIAAVRLHRYRYTLRAASCASTCVCRIASMQRRLAEGHSKHSGSTSARPVRCMPFVSLMTLN